MRLFTQMLSWPVLSIGTFFVLSLPISATKMVTFVPLSDMFSSCEGVTPVHCLPFIAGNICLLGAETFLWIPSNTCLNWRFFRLVLFNVKIWSVPYWFVAAITVGTISDFWAFAEKSQERTKLPRCWINSNNKKKIKEGRWYGTGEEKVCSQKL